MVSQKAKHCDSVLYDTATRDVASNVYNYRFSNPVAVILSAYTTCDDGTDRVFRNVRM